MLKNLGNLMSSLLVAATVAAVARPHWGRRIAVAAAGLLAARVFHKLGDFRIFNLEITCIGVHCGSRSTRTSAARDRRHGGGDPRGRRTGPGLEACLGTAAGAGASACSLPVYAYAAFTAAIAVSFGGVGRAMPAAEPGLCLGRTLHVQGIQPTVCTPRSASWLPVCGSCTADHAPCRASGLIVALGAYMGLA